MAVAKEPWEMTQKEYVADLSETFEPVVFGTQVGSKVRWRGTGEKAIAKQKADILRGAPEAHRYKVRQALEEGKSVPPEVLKDYPELEKPSPIEAVYGTKRLAEIQEEETKKPKEWFKEARLEDRLNVGKVWVRKDGKIFARFDEYPELEPKAKAVTLEVTGVKEVTRAAKAGEITKDEFIARLLDENAFVRKGEKWFKPDASGNLNEATAYAETMTEEFGNTYDKIIAPALPIAEAGKAKEPRQMTVEEVSRSGHPEHISATARSSERKRKSHKRSGYSVGIKGIR